MLVNNIGKREQEKSTSVPTKTSNSNTWDSGTLEGKETGKESFGRIKMSSKENGKDTNFR